MELTDRSSVASETQNGQRSKTPVHPGIGILRRAMRANVVSFPSQIPSLLKEPAGDIQWRSVVLFFVCGWRSAEIAARFHVPTHRMRKSLDAWSVRAMALGYVQVIDAEAFARCCREHADSKDDDPEERPPAESGPGGGSVRKPLAHVLAAMEDESSVAADESGRLTARLDAATERCEELREKFRVLAAMLSRELRAAEEIALELGRSRQKANVFAAGFEGGEIHSQTRLRVNREEEVSHAVA